MRKDDFERISVSSSRFESGTWEGDREIGEGDIRGSYSADAIATENRIRTPFRHGSHLWCCVSVYYNREFEAYRVLPESMFQDPVTSYSGKVRANGGEDARNDLKGFYHGMAVRNGANRYVLTGPPYLFVADPESQPPAPAQLELFGCEVQP